MTQNADAYRLYQQGMGYLRRFGHDNLDRAIAAFQGAVHLDRNYALAYARMGEAYQRRYTTFTRDAADAAQARSTTSQAAAEAPDLPAVQAVLGLIEVGAGEYGRAAESYKRAIAADPTSAEALAGLARAYERLGQRELAQTTYQRAIDAHPDFWLPYNQAGVFYTRIGQDALAERMFAMVAALVPDNPLGPTNQAALDLILGRYTEADKALQKVIAIAPSAAAYSNLGTSQFAQHRYGAAVMWFEKAVKLSSNDDRLWRNLGDAYAKVAALANKAPDAYRHAIALAQKQVNVNPSNADARTALALYYAKVGDRTHALANLQISADNAALSSEIELRVADTYELMGDRNRAFEWLATAIRSGLSFKQIEDDPDLEQLRRDSQFTELRSRAQIQKAQ
jgi:tetratricopeptide (TPR) repeat protein